MGRQSTASRSIWVARFWNPRASRCIPLVRRILRLQQVLGQQPLPPCRWEILTALFCKLADVNVEGLGKELETNAVFPDRANIEFVEVAAPDSLLMRVWERGSGETQACGSGACAAVVAGVLTGRCARHCSVSLPGGCLDVEWREADNKVYLTGPAQFVFEGTVDV